MDAIEFATNVPVHAGVLASRATDGSAILQLRFGASEQRVPNHVGSIVSYFQPRPSDIRWSYRRWRSINPILAAASAINSMTRHDSICDLSNASSSMSSAISNSLCRT